MRAACREGYVDLVEFLLHHPAIDFPNNAERFINDAIGMGRWRVLPQLLCDSRLPPRVHSAAMHRIVGVLQAAHSVLDTLDRAHVMLQDDHSDA